MPIVYVVQEQPNHDLAPAMEFGRIKTILPPGDANFSYEFTVSKLREVLRDFQLDDYLLLTGDPVAIGLATTIVFNNSYPEPVNMLKWMRRERKYLPVKISID